MLKFYFCCAAIATGVLVSAFSEPLIQRQGPQRPSFVSLSSGKATPDPPQADPVAVRSLQASEVAELLRRLPDMPTEPAGREFSFPPQSQPAPRPELSQAQPFPAKEADAAAVNGADRKPLQILRYGPTGTVANAGQVFVAFSHPMVPLQSHSASRVDLAVQIEPEVPGAQWRWLGTRTLVYDSPKALPKATVFRITVPAGMRDMRGQALAEATSWNFQTPPPKVVSFHPSGGASQPLRPLMVALFDQQVDADVVRDKVQLVPGGNVVAPDGDDPAVVAQLKRYNDEHSGRFVAFVPAAPLPMDQRIEVFFPANLPSREGPLTSQSPVSFYFNTYRQFNVAKLLNCTREEPCDAGSSWVIKFSNPIDSNSFSPEMVQVEPALPDLNVYPSGDQLIIWGTPDQKQYQVTISPQLQDFVGQELGQQVRFNVHIGSFHPDILMPQQNMMVLPDGDDPQIPFRARNIPNLTWRVFAVKPSDWPAYLKWQNDVQQQKEVPNPFQLLQKIEQPLERNDQWVDGHLALKPFLGQSAAFVVTCEVPEQNSERRVLPSFMPWVQVSPFGLDVVADGKQVWVRAYRFEDGSPLSDVEIGLFSFQNTGRSLAKAASDRSGMAVFRLQQGWQGGKLISASWNGYSAMVPERDFYTPEPRSQLEPRKSRQELLWYLTSDRHVYRPGETVHIKGWLRQVNLENPLPRLVDPGGTLWLTLSDSRGNKLHQTKVPLTSDGGFSTEIALPENINLGGAHLQARFDHPNENLRGMGSHYLEVQEYRTPEFEVNVAVQAGPHFVGDRAAATLQAKYYAGGGLSDAAVDWRLALVPTYYWPPNLSDYSFGETKPWWHRGVHVQYEHATFRGLTDARGQHELALEIANPEKRQAYRATLEGRVTDLNRQQWVGQSEFIIHPASHYLGLRTSQRYLSEGTQAEIDLVVSDLDGRLQAGRAIAVTVLRHDRIFEKGRYRDHLVEIASVDLSSESVAVTYSHIFREPGLYTVRGQIQDPEGRANFSEILFWVFGPDLPDWLGRVGDRGLRLSTDRESYAPGESVKLMIESPFVPAHGMLILQTNVETRAMPLALDQAVSALTLEMPRDALSNASVQVLLSGEASRADEGGAARPPFASAHVGISLPATEHRLKVAVEPEQKILRPGQDMVIQISVARADGSPAEGAAVALMVVDEAALALTDFAHPDPWDYFFPHTDLPFFQRRSADYLPHGLGSIFPFERRFSRGPFMRGVAIEEMAMAEAPTTSLDAAETFNLRSDFRATAVFLPDLKTDNSGLVAAEVKLPDSTTRFRVIALAAQPQHFGKGESAVTTRLPVTLAPSPPRFLNYGDACELPLMVRNQSDQTVEVDLLLRAQNARLPQGGARRLQLKPGQRAEVRIAVSTLAPGVARFQAAMVAGEQEDAVQFEIPVYTPATTETFATYGQMSGEGSQTYQIEAPTNAISQFGGLQIGFAPTALHALGDAVSALQQHPWDSSEILASRVLVLAQMGDALDAFSPVVSGSTAPKDRVAEDLKQLLGRQTRDGGFGFWNSREASWPFVSIHAAHALLVARDAGLAGPDLERAFQRVWSYLKQMPQHLDAKNYFHGARDALLAYALYVRALAGERDLNQAGPLLQRADQLSPESVAWLMEVYASQPKPLAKLQRSLLNRLQETASTASFTSNYQRDGYLLCHSSRRGDAVVLNALIRHLPTSDLIPKLLRGLEAGRVRGRWSTTQENCFAILALKAYFEVFEKEPPHFEASAWFGEQVALQSAFSERTQVSSDTQIPMSLLLAGRAPVTIAVQGRGRLYYRLGLSYAPENLQLEPEEQGFYVARRYEGIDDPGDVRRDENGTWHIAAGARVRVIVDMVSPARRAHVGLKDPLPAGFEALQGLFKTTGLPDSGSPSLGPTRTWFAHWYSYQNLRDQAAEAYVPNLAPGAYEYQYIALATTPGRFVVPPPKAEELYAPETFGRGATDIVIVQ